MLRDPEGKKRGDTKADLEEGEQENGQEACRGLPSSVQDPRWLENKNFRGGCPGML